MTGHRDDGTDDRLTLSLDDALSDELSRRLTVYPGLSHLMKDAVTRCDDNERCMDLV